MDKECIRICDALNRLPSIRTIESCCGHGKDDFRVWFKASDIRALNCLGRLMSPNYSPYPWGRDQDGRSFWKWRIELDYCDVIDYSSETLFCLRGNLDNPKLYEEADGMADYLEDLWEDFCRYTLRIEPFFEDKDVSYDGCGDAEMDEAERAERMLYELPKDKFERLKWKYDKGKCCGSGKND